MSRRIGVISGPGHHAPAIAQALDVSGHDVKLVEPYAHYRVHRPGDSGNEASKLTCLFHDGARYLSAGLQYRLRDWLPWSFDFDIYNRIFAALAARAVVDRETVIAFSYVATEVLEQSLTSGQEVILEEPASHAVAFWSATDDEHERAGLRPDAASISPTPWMLDRAVREYQLASRIRVLSQFARRTLTDRGVDASKVEVVPPGVDTNFFTPSSCGRVDGPMRLLFVGRIELMKGVRPLLDAISRLSFPVELHLAGRMTAPARTLLGRSSARVIEHGVLGPEALRTAYRTSDVVVFPSLSDGFGLVILEAMACGKPVIATTHSGGPDAIEHNVEGWLVGAGDVPALAESIEALAEQKLRIALGTCARRRVSAEFSLEAYRARVNTWD